MAVGSARARRAAAAVTVGLVAVATIAGAAGAQPADGISIRLLDAPVDRRDDPRAHAYIVDHVVPGTSFTRRVEVRNHGDEPVDVALDPGAADVTADGFVFADAGVVNDVTGWTSVEPATMRLAGGETGIATAVVDVPAGAPNGERYGVIWAAVAESPEEGVRTVHRVGVRIYLSVGDGEEPAPAFEVSTLTAGRDATGRPVVEAEVTNVGGRAVDVAGELVLEDGPGGTTAGPFPVATASTVGIGGTASVSVPLARELPAGPWLARLTLRSGTVTRVVEATITFPDAAGTRAPPVAAEAPGATGGPATLAAASVLCVAIALGWTLRRRGVEILGRGRARAGSRAR